MNKRDLERKCAKKIVCGDAKCKTKCKGYDTLCPDYVPIAYADMTIEEIKKDYNSRKEIRESLE